MNRGYSLIIVMVLFFQCGFSQDVPLFQAKEPINLRIHGSIKSIKKKSNDSTFVTGKLQYKKESGEWMEVKGKARVRGNYRLENCYFPPLKLRFAKKDVASSL